MRRALRLVIACAVLALAGTQVLRDLDGRLAVEQRMLAREAQRRAALDAQALLREELALLREPGAAEARYPVKREDPASIPAKRRPLAEMGLPHEAAVLAERERVWGAAARQRAAGAAPRLVVVETYPFLVLPGPEGGALSADLLFQQVERQVAAGAAIRLDPRPGAFPVTAGGLLEGDPTLWVEAGEPEPAAPARAPWDWRYLGFLLVGAAFLAGDGLALARARITDRTRREEREALLQRISHYLRTPAASALSLAGALRDVPDLGEAERREMLALLEEEARRLAKGTTRLLQAARGDGSWPLEIAPLDLAPWARDLAARWRRREPDLEVVAADSALLVEADPEQLEEAVEALLDNARKYGAPPIRLLLRIEREFAVLTVSDAGRGVPDADRERVLQKLERGGSGQGFGLGLWAAVEIARGHGGRLEIEPGGSAFSLYLPLAPRLHRAG